MRTRLVPLFASALVILSTGSLALAGDGVTQPTSPTRLSALMPVQSQRLYSPAPRNRDVQKVSGAECPAMSGKYCSDQFPVCCLVSGTWGCYAKLADCKEK